MLIAAGLLGLLAIVPTTGAEAHAALLDEPASIDRMIGDRVANFALTDVRTGRRVGLYSFYGKKAVVLVFTGIDCPIGNVYMPRLVALSEKYGDQGVTFLAINANASESAEEIAKHAEEYKIGFPVLADPSGRAAGSLQAERTCEALVLDGTAKLRYRGAIDDQYGYGVRKNEPEVYYLADAIDAILAGDEPEPAATPVEGCPIDRDDSMASNLPAVRPAADAIVEALGELEPAIDPESLGPVTYNDQVAPILHERCETCHQPGQVGPFAMLDYGDAKRWATSIGEVVDDRRMPPWHADPRFGEFRNDRHLSPLEHATLIAWVDQGAPEGDRPAPADEGQAETADTDASRTPEGWSIGTPDVVFEIPEPYKVQADGALPYQHFRVKTNFTEDKWVSGIQTKPTARAAVHHIIVYLRDPNNANGNRGGFEGGMEHLAGYAPGDIPSEFPPGAAKKIPAGAELVFQIHYTPIGKEVVDRTAVGMVFADEPPTARVRTLPIANMRFRIPPGAPDREVVSRTTIQTEGVELIGLFPHMHLRGKDFKFTAVDPDGTEEVLLSVPQYDFAWQSYYWLAEPKPLPPGTKLECVAHFDNSAANPALTEADTKEEVRWGEQTWDEMMIGYIDITTPIEPAKSATSAQAETAVTSEDGL